MQSLLEDLLDHEERTGLGDQGRKPERASSWLSSQPSLSRPVAGTAQQILPPNGS